MGLLLGLLTVPLGLSQHVTGIGVTLLATSMAYYHLPGAAAQRQHAAPHRARSRRSPTPGSPICRWSARCWPSRPRSPSWRWRWSRSWPGCSTARPWDSRCAPPVTIRARSRRRGIDVYALRIGALVAGSALMAVGGAFLTLSAFNAFFFGMVNGRGWICIALVVFASWRPGKALLGALLFGAFDAFQIRLQQLVGRCRALPAVPDAALSPQHPRPDPGRPPRRLSRSR